MKAEVAVPVLKLAIRGDGSFWNAYLMDPKAEGERLLIGTLHKGVAGDTTGATFQAWVKLLGERVGQMVEGVVGQPPIIGPAEREEVVGNA